MKRTTILIILSSVTLLGLLALQVLYVVRAANIKEQQFNESVTMALCKVADMMCSESESCSGWESCCMNPSHGTEECNIKLSEQQKSKMDSLLNYYMDYYHIHLDYRYEVVRTENTYLPSGRSGSFGQKLNAGLPGQYQLRLDFPGKDKFILSEMKGIFIVTVILIFILLALFIITIRSLIKNTDTLKRSADFVNNMTHELNTPISNIGLAAAGLSKPTASPDRKNAYIEIIRNENEKLKQQVERLLDISKLEADGLFIRTQSVDIHRIVQSQVETYKGLTDGNGVLETELAADHYMVNGDALLLANVISNLLDNAFKYSGSPAKVVIGTKNLKDQIVLTISDNGKGIPAKEQSRIFEKYYRIPNGDIHDIKGFGIGLTYVKKVVECHKGSIELISEENKGSTFIIKLPAA